jgi:hypothetical protein
MSVGDKTLETIGLMSPLVFGTLLPFGIIVCCNILIIHTLHAASKRRLEMSQGAQKTGEKEANHLTRMLLLVCFAYVVTSVPYRLHDLIGLPLIEMHHDSSAPYWKLRYETQRYILHWVWEWNYVLNFYLYFVGGGKKFRRDFLNVIQSLKSYKLF